MDIFELQIDERISDCRFEIPRDVDRATGVRGAIQNLEICALGRRVKRACDLTCPAPDSIGELTAYDDRSLSIASAHGSRANDVVKGEGLPWLKNDSIDAARCERDVRGARMVLGLAAWITRFVLSEHCAERDTRPYLVLRNDSFPSEFRGFRSVDSSRIKANPRCDRVVPLVIGGYPDGSHTAQDPEHRHGKRAAHELNRDTFTPSCRSRRHHL